MIRRVVGVGALSVVLVLAAAACREEDPPSSAPTVTTAETETQTETETAAETQTATETETQTATATATEKETQTATEQETETAGNEQSTTGETEAAAPTGGADPPAPYALGATRRCLVRKGATVTKIGSADPRLRELGDLAQQTSIEIRLGDGTVGLAFGNTELLLSLLRAPNDPYQLEVRRNAILMHLPSARAQAAVVRACLRS